MKVDRISHRGWPEAYRCSAGPMELIVVTSMGPRVLSLKFDGGENLLYEDITNFEVGAWHLCGGHRFTTAPESEASYTPDNQPCRVHFEHDRLCIQQRLDDGLLRSLEITPEVDHNGFALRHVLRNCRTQAWYGAAWAITCVPTLGKVLIPKSGSQARFWTPAGGRYADAAHPQWQSTEHYFLVEPQGQKGKIGTRSEPGWLAWLGPDSTFVVSGPSYSRQATYPDDGCNVEVYTCASYLELETLGPLTRLLPGQELDHQERWRVIPRAFTPSEWRAIDKLTQPRVVRGPAAVAAP